MGYPSISCLLPLLQALVLAESAECLQPLSLTFVAEPLFK